VIYDECANGPDRLRFRLFNGADANRAYPQPQEGTVVPKAPKTIPQRVQACDIDVVNFQEKMKDGAKMPEEKMPGPAYRSMQGDERCQDSKQNRWRLFSLPKFEAPSRYRRHESNGDD